MRLFWHTPRRPSGGVYPDPVWPEGWPLPPVGSIVHIENDGFWVGSIDFNPGGDSEDPEPFIYIVLRDSPK